MERINNIAAQKGTRRETAVGPMKEAETILTQAPGKVPKVLVPIFSSATPP